MKSKLELYKDEVFKVELLECALDKSNWIHLNVRINCMVLKIFVQIVV